MKLFGKEINVEKVLPTRKQWKQLGLAASGVAVGVAGTVVTALVAQKTGVIEINKVEKEVAATTEEVLAEEPAVVEEVETLDELLTNQA